MKVRSVASRLSALVGLALLASPAHAAIETFSFVSGSYSINGESGPPYIDAGITGWRWALEGSHSVGAARPHLTQAGRRRTHGKANFP